VTLGDELLQKAAAKAGVAFETIPEAAWASVVKNAGCENKTALLADVGLGKQFAAAIMAKIAEYLSEKKATDASAAGNLIEGTEGIAVQLANCCHPVPGDTVWGFMRKGHGLSIHRADCEHTKHGRANDAERWSEARWCKNRPADARFPVPVELSVTDKLSALPAVAAELAKAGSSIIGVAMTDEKKGTTLEEHELSLVIQVKDKKHLVHTLLQLKQLPMVTAVARKIDGDKKVAV